MKLSERLAEVLSLLGPVTGDSCGCDYVDVSDLGGHDELVRNKTDMHVVCDARSPTNISRKCAW